MDGKPRIKKRLGAVLTVFALFAALALASCEVVEERPVELSWGIPEGMEMFEGAVMEPEGEVVERPEEGVLELTWAKDESYVLPFSAFSEEDVQGVRYLGSGIPEGTALEWKDPWEVEWFPFEALPEEKIRAEIREENGFLTVDFGPPGGADFEAGMTRLAWFRVTPAEAGDFELTIHGYRDNGEEQQEQVTNTIKARVQVEAP